MDNFKPGLSIRPSVDPMGFKYGKECYGPEVENRRLDEIRQSLKDTHCEGPDVVYTIAMDVGKEIHREHLTTQHLLFGVVTYAAGRLGEEPIRSQGHIHKNSPYAMGWSTPEVYQIWNGKAVILMQEYADDDPGRCYAVHAEVGDIVVVPPLWAHATISADPHVPLTFGAWCDRDYGFEYAKVRAHKGLAWHPLYNDAGKLDWHFNDHYQKSDLIEKAPADYTMLSIDQGECIYTQYEKYMDRFLFVPKPYLVTEVWEDFIP